jgi:hypothetical protein
LITTSGTNPRANAFCGQYALDLAAEIRVPGCVHDIDAVVLPANGRVLREYRDAPFALQDIRVHHAIWHSRPWPERAGLLQQLVDERRLAVIHVRDDRDISQSFDIRHQEYPEGTGRARIIRSDSQF